MSSPRNFFLEFFHRVLVKDMSLVPSAQADSLISIQKRAGSVPHLEFLLSGPRGWYCSYIVFYTETKSGLHVLY